MPRFTRLTTLCVTIVLILGASLAAAGCGSSAAPDAPSSRRAEPAAAPVSETTALETAPTASVDETREDLVPYEDPKNGFSVEVPDDWDVLQQKELREMAAEIGAPSPFVFFALSPETMEAFEEGRLAPSFSIVMAPVPRSVTFDEYAARCICEFEAANPSARQIRHRVVELPAGRALVHTFRSKSDTGLQAGFRQYGMIRDGKEYVLVFETSAATLKRDMALFEQIARSFRFTR